MKNVNQLKTGKVYNINYTNNKEERSSRIIVPIKLPTHNIKAIDVTSLEVDQQENVATLAQEYNEYLSRYLEAAFSFDAFVEHTTGTPVELKWRTFNPDKIEF